MLYYKRGLITHLPLLWLTVGSTGREADRLGMSEIREALNLETLQINNKPDQPFKASKTQVQTQCFHIYVVSCWLQAPFNCFTQDNSWGHTFSFPDRNLIFHIASILNITALYVWHADRMGLSLLHLYQQSFPTRLWDLQYSQTWPGSTASYNRYCIYCIE
jgi:hypothetical protein